MMSWLETKADVYVNLLCFVLQFAICNLQSAKCDVSLLSCGLSICDNSSCSLVNLLQWLEACVVVCMTTIIIWSTKYSRVLAWLQKTTRSFWSAQFGHTQQCLTRLSKFCINHRISPGQIQRIKRVSVYMQEKPHDNGLISASRASGSAFACYLNGTSINQVLM